MCRNGDHYLAQYEVRHGGPSFGPPIVETDFYVIKGESCVKVNDLTEPLYNIPIPAFTSYDFKMADPDSERKHFHIASRMLRGAIFTLLIEWVFIILSAVRTTLICTFEI